MKCGQVWYCPELNKLITIESMCDPYVLVYWMTDRGIDYGNWVLGGFFEDAILLGDL